MLLGGNLTISTSTKSQTMMETATLCQANEVQLIAAQDLPDAIKGMIQQQIARIKQEYSYILDCKVDVAVPTFCQTGIYQVRIVLTLPDLDLKIDREPTPDCYQEDIYVAIWSAFDLARKKLKQHSIPTNNAVTIAPVEKVSYPSIRTVRRCRGYAQG
jgi:ribosome-associated translation inhibitor RaiA